MLFKLRLKNLNIEIEELKISIVLIWQKNLFIGRIAYRSNVSFRLEIIWFRLTYDQCAIKGSNPYNKTLEMKWIGSLFRVQNDCFIICPVIIVVSTENCLKSKKVGLKEVSHIAVSGVSVLQFCQFTWE